MKNILLLLFPIFSGYKWYRKKIGGKWYFVSCITDKTIDGVIGLWTQKPADNDTVKKEENYYTN